MATYRTPGVYVEEISTLPPSVADVATAVPAFIGYTQTSPAGSATPVIRRVATMLEFETAFGGPQPAKFAVAEEVDPVSGESTVRVSRTPSDPGGFCLYYALSHYFRNGGGPCYVVSVGDYSSTPAVKDFEDGLAALEKEDEPTLIVPTDAVSVLSRTDYYSVCGAALAQCKALGDRFTILDVAGGDWKGFRDDGNLSANLMYGAAYLPYLQTSIPWRYDEADVSVSRAEVATTISPTTASGSLAIGGDAGMVVSFTGPAASAPTVELGWGYENRDPDFTLSGDALKIVNVNGKDGAAIAAAWSVWAEANQAGGFSIQSAGAGTAKVATEAVPPTPVPLTSGGAAASNTLDGMKDSETALYNKIKSALADERVVLPPSAAMAGIYARVDREQGVWKAPANVGVMSVIGPVEKITNDDQDQLNIDAVAGKSINAIRAFTGKGTLVWGARTLAGNDNEWRYINVRRLFITIEESTRKASAFAVFEANDQSTWLKVKAMIESYLYGLWEQGALAGSKPEEAYYVHVGLGTTMTPQDVLEGRMIVEIGVAAVRPAEFIVLRFSHKLQTA